MTKPDVAVHRRAGRDARAEGRAAGLRDDRAQGIGRGGAGGCRGRAGGGRRVPRGRVWGTGGVEGAVPSDVTTTSLFIRRAAAAAVVVVVEKNVDSGQPRARSQCAPLASSRRTPSEDAAMGGASRSSVGDATVSDPQFGSC